MELWEVLVPKTDNEGKEFSLEFHKEWDNYIKTIAGGLTVMRSAKGMWKGYEERMIPVRIACERDELEHILSFTKNHYSQEAVFAVKLSEEVIIY